MKTILLSRGLVALVDDDDYPVLARYKWFASSATHRVIYAKRKTVVGRGKYSDVWMHRVILNAPDGMKGDHINGNGLDNQRHNLRLATTSQNQANLTTQPRSSSGYRGVVWNGQCQKWQAQIGYQGKYKYIGVFEDAVDAARAYDRVARDLFGEFARPNFVEAAS